MKNKLIVQDNLVTTARYEMTALEKNIVYSVMAQIEDNDPPSKFYKISISDIEDTKDVRVRQERFDEAIKKLLTRELVIMRPDGGKLRITVISSADYDLDGNVEIGIDLKMRPYLFELKKNFTIFSLEVATSLRSKYSKRLYEMLCQFKSTGFLRISVQELRERFELSEERYERWSNFEKNVLKTAQTEINDKADFKFDYHLKKQKKRIVSVEFIFRKSEVKEVKPEPPPVVSLPITEITHYQQVNPRMVERLENYGLTTEQINRIVTKNTEKIINKHLYELDCNKETIKNTAAYLLKIFEA
jgi:plasmid replication initiation protein